MLLYKCRLLVCSFVIVTLLLSCVQLTAQAPEAKRQAVIKSARKYKGIAIESIVPTDDRKGVIIKTADGKNFFLNPEETKQQLDITITDYGFVLPKDAGITYYDQNGVPSDAYQNERYTNINQQVLPYPVKTFHVGVVAHSVEPLYIINGKEASKEDMQQLNPSTIEKIDVLKGDGAILAYGDRGRNGVVVITLKSLYIINGKESSKEEMTKLDSSTIKSVTVLNIDSASAIYGEKGKNGVIIITLKTISKDTIRATFPGGTTAWRRYIERSLNYPRTAQANRTQGVIRVMTTISETGKITFAKALNDPGDGLAEEAERVIKESPTWIPATLEGKPIPISFVQKITFRLS